MPGPHRITIPTFFTISRFFLVPVFIGFFLSDRFRLAVIVLIIASLTDMVDGFIARRYNMRSRLGSMLDPLADKFMMLVSFIVLSYRGVIPWLVTFVVIGRDFTIVLGAFYLNNIKRINLVFKPTKFSKVTTFSQFLLLAFSFLEVFILKKSWDPDAGLTRSLLIAQQTFLYVAGILTVITFFQYGKIGMDFLRYGERKKI